MPNPFFIPLLKRLATEVGAEVIVDEPSQGEVICCCRTEDVVTLNVCHFR
jgi:hypothetical protein